MSFTNKPGNDGIVLTEEQLKSMKKKLNPNELPDTNLILLEVEKILEKMTEDDLIRTKQENFGLYKVILEKEFSEFSTRYPALFNLVISGENLEMLLIMIESLNKIKQTNSYGEEEDNLRDKLADKFIFNDLNNKEKEELKEKLGFK